jgi:biotin synthase-like enzyme
MRILLSVFPLFQDANSNYHNAHLGNACIKAYLKQYYPDLVINTIDLRNFPGIERVWAFNLPVFSFSQLFISDIQDLPLITSLVQNYRKNKNVVQLLEPDHELAARWAMERAIFPGRMIDSLKKMNLFAFKYLRYFEGYDLLGFSLYNTNIYLSVFMALLIRIMYPKTRIVFGGPQVTQGETTREFLLKSGVADFLVIGEGEQPMLEVVNALQSGGSIDNIHGVKTLGNFTSPDTFSENANLDKLPLPDFEGINFSALKPPLIPVYSNRGCPFRCNFCSEHSLFGKKFKRRAPERVLQDMRELSKKYGVSNFAFMDSLLNSSEKWLEEFSDLAIKSDEKFLWSGYQRASLNEKLVKKIKKAGLTLTTLGVESFSQATLDHMNKRRVNSEIIDSINFLMDNGVMTSINIVVGYPEESIDDFLDTMKITNDFYEKYDREKKLEYFSITARTFRLQPFSNNYGNYEHMGIEVKNWAHYYSPDYYPEDLKGVFDKTLCTFDIKNMPVSELIKREYIMKQIPEKYQVHR